MRLESRSQEATGPTNGPATDDHKVFLRRKSDRRSIGSTVLGLILIVGGFAVRIFAPDAHQTDYFAMLVVTFGGILVAQSALTSPLVALIKAWRDRS